jgi:anthranilate synthase component 1
MENKKKYKLKSIHKKILADSLTPVSIYLKIRDQFPHSLLLESSDYDARANNFSYICCNPIAFISISRSNINFSYPDGSKYSKVIDSKVNIPDIVQSFSNQFESEKYPFKFITNGLFGYISHEAIGHFESISLNKNKNNFNIPEIYYAVYQNIIAISLFNHEAHLFSNTLTGEDNLDKIEQIIKNDNIVTYQFEKKGKKSSNLSDEEFLALVQKGKEHCFRGDVFQLVLSRRFFSRLYRR